MKRLKSFSNACYNLERFVVPMEKATKRMVSAYKALQPRERFVLIVLCSKKEDKVVKWCFAEGLFPKYLSLPLKST